MEKEKTTRRQKQWPNTPRTGLSSPGAGISAYDLECIGVTQCNAATRSVRAFSKEGVFLKVGQKDPLAQWASCSLIHLNRFSYLFSNLDRHNYFRGKPSNSHNWNLPGQSIYAYSRLAKCAQTQQVSYLKAACQAEDMTSCGLCGKRSCLDLPQSWAGKSEWKCWKYGEYTECWQIPTK